MDSTEKCYVTRDEDSNWVWVWRKPTKGNWSPANICGKDFINYQRQDHSLENTDAYLANQFKKKFGIIINKKEKICIYLPIKLLDNEDYKLFSNNPKRKK